MKRAGQLPAATENTGAGKPLHVLVSETSRPSLLDDERGNRVALPADYPEWRRDDLTLSRRAKLLLGKLRPFVIRVFTFWDHRVSSLALDELTLDVDASGSYRAH